ncbi:hypothetical protein Rleg2_4167 [Rhizobium leguminosarum bv. trifolii WSM2304]|uniref:Uncharacterized protein n=1 Tax=Rhizobium leguminosarum bv. trifolii (strain WSM2304) TaxID=395492 RepID=A0ABF7QU02_RHILW|nr:hypothetical protein [Rhizobium leguminosarum]ACI57429.1 hypothetical protein Rleg2_4167 [Rhizobium leguminosarum bv. trifolii WSM2304]
MAQYEISASRPTPNSDFEFYTAGFEILAEKPYMPELLAALASPGRPSGPFAHAIAKLRENKRREIIADMADAGLLAADQSVAFPAAIDALIDELADGRLASIKPLLEHAFAASAAGYRLSPFLRVLSAAENIAGSPTAAAHLLGRNSAAFAKVLTRHHIARARTRYAQAVRAWLSVYHLPVSDILMAIVDVDRLWFLALQKVREDAKQHPNFRRLRGLALARAIDEQRPLWSQTLDAATALDASAGRPLKTVLSVVLLDMACPRLDRLQAA